MTYQGVLQYAGFLAIVVACAKPLGAYLQRVFFGGTTVLDPILEPVERALYRLTGVDPSIEMSWKRYALAFALFGALGVVLLFAILMAQQMLPWFFGEYQTTPMTFDLALNTAISFATTTTWQAYGGETTMSYFTQMTGLAAQNFLAGAAGLAVGVAFIRGFARAESDRLGNFWVDLTRAILWILVPMSLVGALLLVWQGVPMNVDPYTHARTLEGGTQVIAQGPVAALESIKNLGTNGGGFFNVNGAHPFENPTPLANLLNALMIAVLPAALVITFGTMVGRPKQGWLILGVMTGLFALGLAVTAVAEQAPLPAIAGLAVTADASAQQAGGNMEGKEARFGVHGSVLTAVATSNGATGSYNAMHDSFSPIGGLVPLSNMLLGELVYGGLGSGLYSMVMMILVTVFIGGLMVGRTPIFLGKNLGAGEMTLVALYIIAGSVTMLILTAIAVVSPGGIAGLTTNQGAHGFSEILYAYISAFANNGQNLAGLSANSPFYNFTLIVAMLIGRFGLATLALALAGSVAAQKTRPPSPGHIPTDTPLFAALLVGNIFILGGLSYLPALALGPLAEQFAS